MEDIFGQIECRTKSDSVVMRILRSAMDEAHEKLQSRDGPIQFLHNRSTFYELAAILVEGGLAIVQDEKTDATASHCDKILSDLSEIKSWLGGRIHDMCHLIIDKDRQLIDLSETELRLQKSLELKEREISYLHERLEPGRAENEDIFRLKDSIDQQVSCMKQKLYEERRALSIERRNNKMRVSSPNLSFDFLDKERNGSPIFKEEDDIPDVKPNNQNLLIRKMSWDIDVLKETLDLAFGRMKSVMTFPLETQWACSVERDVEFVLVKGFMEDLRRGTGLHLNERAGFMSDDWMEFIDAMRNLCHELRNFFNTNDVQERGPVIARCSSEPLSEIEFTGDRNDCNEADGKKHVAKIKKNFESIIRKQVEELGRLRREGGEGSFYRAGRGKDGSRLERRIRDVITRLENLTKRGQQKKSNRSSGNEVKRLKVEIEKLKEDRDALVFENFVMQDTYSVVLQGMKSDFRETLEKDHIAVEGRKEWWAQKTQERKWRKMGEDLGIWKDVMEEMVGNLEDCLEEKVERKCMRLQSLKREVDSGVGRKSVVYKKAFVSRCQMLMLAEAEVDLLGDQVESLLCLVERIYFELNQNAAVFSAYFEVYDILKLIKNELLRSSL